MFKPTVAYCEIQKRKKMIIGMHLVELSDRYHYFNIVGLGRGQKQKNTSYSQNQKLEFLFPKHMTTLPVTPTSKSPSFLENSQLLVLKQVIELKKYLIIIQLQEQNNQSQRHNYKLVESLNYRQQVQ